MTTHTFTDPQAEHAREAVLKLMKERRFFLYRDDPRSTEKNPGWKLDQDVFKDALVLDNSIRDVYSAARKNAEGQIAHFETYHGIVGPDLSRNKQVVQCSRYTGGLDICRVFPLTAFSEYVPKSLDTLTKQCLKQILQDTTEDDLAPKALRQYQDFALKTSEKIWNQFDTMAIRKPNNPLCVVMMKTRFDCDCGGSDEKGDFMESRTRGMQKFPHAMGYLFYMYSLRSRVVQHNHVVFSTSRRSHVNVQHWSGERKPTINYGAEDGYTCSVVFVTVL